jgi:alkylhydroperoxidase family enzyme
VARVPYIDPGKLAPEKRSVSAINLVRAMSNSPGAERSLSALVRYLRTESKLDRRLMELAILQVGWLAKAPYEFAHHIEFGRKNGVTDEDIRAIADETEGKKTHLGPVERAVLRAAREMTLETNLSDATFAELKASLDDERLVDLVLSIAHYNGVVRLLSALRIDVEEDCRHLLDEFPF